MYISGGSPAPTRPEGRSRGLEPPAPPNPNDPIIPIAESSRCRYRVQHILPIIGLAPARAPRVAGGGALIEEAEHETSAEVHAPRERGIARTRRRRPVVGRPHTSKGAVALLRSVYKSGSRLVSCSIIGR